MEKIYIGSDHAGFELKEEMKEYLKKLEYDVEDLGSREKKENDDYPDYAQKVGKKIQNSDSKGILFCGSSEGVCIAANKIKGIRAATAWNKEIAKKSREHNNANILCLSGWYLETEETKEIIKTWLKTDFTGEKRHKRRLNKIKEIENNEL